MVIAICKGLQNTVFPVDISERCNSSWELQGICLEKPDQRLKNLVLVGTYIHPGTASTKPSWDFMAQIEDELGHTVVMCGYFNARCMGSA